MDIYIYYREDVGLQTPQLHNTDYFCIEEVAAKLRTNEALATINFWEKLEDAQANVSANNQRQILWPIGTETDIAAAIAALLQMEDVATTVGDIISLKGAVIQ